MEAYLPKNSRELIISFEAEEAFFCLESLRGWIDHTLDQKNKIGITKRQQRRKTNQARDLYNRINDLKQPHILRTRIGDRELLQEALPFSLKIIDEALLGDPDPSLVTAYSEDPDKLLIARHNVGGMIAALELGVIKQKTETYEALTKELIAIHATQ